MYVLLIEGKLIIDNGWNWKAAGITEAVRDARATVSDIIDPFAALAI